MDGDNSFRSDSYSRNVAASDGLPPPYGGSLVQAFVPAHQLSSLLDRIQALPALHIARSELFDLELIASGALSPLTGFMDSQTYDSVLRRAALPDGMPWGLPVTLAVARDVSLKLRMGEEIALFVGAQPVGVMRVDDVYAWDPELENRLLGPAQDDTHVRERRNRDAACLLGGPVALLAARDADYMQDSHAWPLELRSQFVRHAWRQVSVPHVYSPWRRTDEYLLKCGLEASDALLVHSPICPGSTSNRLPADIQASASRMLIENYFPAGRVFGNPLPAAFLSPTPRAALMHAIASQNYGASALYIPDTVRREGSRELFDEAFRHGLLVRPAFVPAAFHCEPCGGIATHKSCPHDSEQRINWSDQDIGDRLARGEPMSPLIVRADIARFIAREVARGATGDPAPHKNRHIHPHASEVSRSLREALAGHKSCALWMTGLSGSGKSTIAHRLERDLLLAGHRIFVLDGDTLRHGLNHDLGFSETDRRENLRRAAEVAKVMVDAGLIVVASFISPFRAERELVREILGTAFHEIHVHASLEDCEKRDPKGLYRRARAGQIPHFTGVSSPYEPPESPDLRIDTAIESADAAARHLRDFLATRGIIRQSVPSPHHVDGPMTTGGAISIQ